METTPGKLNNGRNEFQTWLASLLEGEDRYDEAIAVLQQALVIDPEEPESYNKLDALYSDTGRHNEAIAMRRHYVALSPKEPNAHDSLGLTYQWAGLYPQAIEEYDKALAFDPNFEIALVHLANAHFQMGHYREAIRLNRRYVEIAPSSLEQSRGYANLAWIHWKQGDLNEAAQAATEASRLGKGWLPLSILIAAKRGDLERAEEIDKQLSATDPPFSDRGSRVTLRHLSLPARLRSSQGGACRQSNRVIPGNLAPRAHYLGHRFARILLSRCLSHSPPLRRSHH